MTHRHLITGERDWRDLDAVADVIGALQEEFGERLVIVHGACPTGADNLAHIVCANLGVATDPYPVDHKLDGPWPAAGPRRNRRMYNANKVDNWTAFWSGKRVKSGTLDCFSGIVADLGVNGNVIARAR